MKLQKQSNMKFFRNHKQADLYTARPAPARSWTSRFNPFKRLAKPATPVSVTPNAFSTVPLSITPISTPALSEASTPDSPISDYSSRPSSILSMASSLPSEPPPIPPKSLERQNSIFSHRSLNIRRDNFRPPPAIPPSPIFVRPATATGLTHSEDSLILTATVSLLLNTALAQFLNLSVQISKCRSRRYVRS
jgi:hypothetical protein